MRWLDRDIDRRLEVLRQNGCIIGHEPVDYLRLLKPQVGEPPYDWALEDDA